MLSVSRARHAPRTRRPEGCRRSPVPRLLYACISCSWCSLSAAACLSKTCRCMAGRCGAMSAPTGRGPRPSRVSGRASSSSSYAPDWGDVFSGAAACRAAAPGRNRAHVPKTQPRVHEELRSKLEVLHDHPVAPTHPTCAAGFGAFYTRASTLLARMSARARARPDLPLRYHFSFRRAARAAGEVFCLPLLFWCCLSTNWHLRAESPNQSITTSAILPQNL